MNVDLRIEYKRRTKDKGALTDEDRKNRYLAWLEDELTKQREIVKNLTIPVVSQQSELLINFDDWLNKKENEWLKEMPTEYVWNTFKLINCG